MDASGDVMKEKPQDPSRKHKLPRTKVTATKKATVGLTNLKRDTEVIFRILLKDNIKQWVNVGQCSNESETNEEPSKDYHVELPTDIEADSITEESDDNKSAVDVAAERLGQIGDALDKEFKKDDTFHTNVIAASQALLANASYKAFDGAITSLLDDRTKYSQDAGDKYQIALMMLCLRSALSKVDKQLTATYNIADNLISNAVNFVENHYPTWLNN